MSYAHGSYEFEVVLAGLILFVEPRSDESTIVHAVLPTHDHPHTPALAFEGSLVPETTPAGYGSPPRHTTWPGPIHAEAVGLRTGDHRPVWGTFGIRNRVLELLPDPLPEGSAPVASPLAGSPPCGSPPHSSGLECVVSLDRLVDGVRVDRTRALRDPWWNSRVAARVDFDTRYWSFSTEGVVDLEYCLDEKPPKRRTSAMYVRATAQGRHLGVRVRSLFGSKSFAFTEGGILGVGNLPQLPETFQHFSRLYDLLEGEVDERWVPCDQQREEIRGVGAACTPAKGT